MAPKGVLWSAVLVLVGSGLSEAQAPAGVVQVPRTGVTRCFGTNGYEIPCASTGQDGELRAGVTWPAIRFTIGTGAEADCITDNLTGLMWPRNQNLTPMTWEEAVDYAAALHLCGHTDWRLANINEAESLLPLGVSTFDWRTWFSGQGFGAFGGIAGNVWSSTSADSSVGQAWALMGDEWRFTPKIPWGTYASPVRLAQAGGPSLLPRTGARTSYRPGDDADYLAGAPWPSPRFVDNTDGTVTDRLTGLMWLKDANCIHTSYQAFDNDDNTFGWTPHDGDVTWGHAFDFVRGINAGTYALCGAGHSDWRLPNRRELMSLVDRGQHAPALPSGHPFANGRNYYWSSTPGMPPDPNVPYTPHAMAVDLVDGVIFGDWTDGADRAVWPVRGGRTGFGHTIAGSIWLGGVGLPGVTLTLSGDAFATTMSDADGSYRFTDLANGVYTLRPGMNGLAFDPASVTVTVANCDVQLYFDAFAASTHSIGGSITDIRGIGVGQVLVVLAGDSSSAAVTDALGSYGFAGLPDGSYTLTPARNGYRFAPASAAVTLAGADATQDSRRPPAAASSRSPAEAPWTSRCLRPRPSAAFRSRPGQGRRSLASTSRLAPSPTRWRWGQATPLPRPA